MSVTILDYSYHRLWHQFNHFMTIQKFKHYLKLLSLLHFVKHKLISLLLDRFQFQRHFDLIIIIYFLLEKDFIQIHQNLKSLLQIRWFLVTPSNQYLVSQDCIFVFIILKFFLIQSCVKFIKCHRAIYYDFCKVFVVSLIFLYTSVYFIFYE